MKKHPTQVVGVCVLSLLWASLSLAADKTFVYCSEGSPSGFNPQLVTDGTSLNASSRTVFNRLVEFERGSTKLKPGLAESWKVSKDGKSYTMKLRKGVKFHTTKTFTPTRDFNADDVIFSFNRQRLESHPFHKVSGGEYEYFKSMEMDKVISDIKKIDDYTIEFVLSRPEAPFLANIAMDYASILSAEYADKMKAANTPEKLDTTPVGTGPFVFSDYVKDSVIRYTANPTYFRGKQKIDRLIFAITPDASVRLQKLRKGECQFVIEPAPADLDAIRKDGKLKLMDQPGLNVAYLGFNVKKKPFDNVMVRQAFNHALNRQSYVEAIYMGNAVVAKNPMPPTIWGYNNAIKDYDYSPEKAKALLAKAGFDKGLEVELYTMPVSRPYNPNGKKMGEMMQADLAKVGVKAKLVSFDWPTYLSKTKNGDHQMLQMGWTGDNGDPDNFLASLLSCSAADAGGNRAFWCNKSYDDIVNKAKVATTQKEREKLYKSAQEIFKKEAPWVTLAHSTVYRAMSDRVTGYKIDPLGSDSFEGVDLK